MVLDIEKGLMNDENEKVKDDELLFRMATHRHKQLKHEAFCTSKNSKRSTKTSTDTVVAY